MNETDEKIPHDVIPQAIPSNTLIFSIDSSSVMRHE